MKRFPFFFFFLCVFIYDYYYYKLCIPVNEVAVVIIKRKSWGVLNVLSCPFSCKKE